MQTLHERMEGNRMTAAQTDDELDTALNRVSLGIDTLAAQRDRLATALRDILELAEDREGPAPPDPWMAVATLARTALGATTRPRRCKGCGHDLSEYAPGLVYCAACEAERGQANLPAVLAGLVLAVAAMWLVGWVGDHAAAGAHVLACVTKAIGG